MIYYHIHVNIVMTCGRRFKLLSKSYLYFFWIIVLCCKCLHLLHGYLITFITWILNYCQSVAAYF